jgi:hypothetical protein
MDFFFLPDEEKEVLAHLLNKRGLNLILETRDTPLELTSAKLSNIRMILDEPKFCQIQLIIWDSSVIQKPVYQEIETKVGRRTEVDFIRTGGVLFEPSVIVRPNVLLEGRLAIMGRSEYERNGMDAKKIRSLYNIVLRELKRFAASDAKVFLKLTNGSWFPQRGELASPGALNWYNQGNLLKQFYDGPGEFCIKKFESQ